MQSCESGKRDKLIWLSALLVMVLKFALTRIALTVL